MACEISGCEDIKKLHVHFYGNGAKGVLEKVEEMYKNFQRFNGALVMIRYGVPIIISLLGAIAGKLFRVF